MEQREIAWLLHEKYHGQKTTDFFTDCARLKAGEPLAYIIGSIPFLSCTIYLDSKPLIPRPETEYWVEHAISSIKKTMPETGAKHPQRENSERGPAKQQSQTLFSQHILDLCAGSGAIGIAVAKALPKTSITFGEIDEAHLPTIEKNLIANTLVNKGISEQYSLVQSDLFENITGTFDYIMSNPPYIDKEALTADASVVDFEPHVALWGGNKGLKVIEHIIVEAPAYLHAGGQLWLEHEPSQTSAIATLAKDNGFTCTTHRDQYQVERYSVLVLQ